MRLNDSSYGFSMAHIRPATGLAVRPALTAESDDSTPSPTAGEPDSTAEASATGSSHTTTLAAPSWRKMSFDVDLNSRSIKVTLSDRNSGEVYRELVYDRSGLLHLSPRANVSIRIDQSV